jgi:serine/threonine protein kinase
MYRPRDRSAELSAEQRQRLAGGRHESVARELRGAGKVAAAGWVLEQIWDFEGALAAYLDAALGLDALRVALEVRDPERYERALAVVRAGSDGDRREAIAMLKRRGRHLDVARLLEAEPERLDDRADALRRGGDRIAAAKALADNGRVAEALASLGALDDPGELPARALAARLAWELGDAEATVRHAQIALRGGYAGDDRIVIQRLLGRALASLGHDLAAQIALEGLDHASPSEPSLPGRYLVRRTLPSTLAGAAYEGIDRVTLQEVELHLLLADFQEAAVGPEIRAALDRFALRAEAAARLAHPAIRPLIRVDADAGLLVLPHAEGPTLRSLIRAPGMANQPTRARALVTFLVEGLAAAHRRGQVHGSLLPSQIVCDAAGRPLLGPFGADALAGLAATRTGSLAEVLTITAPECRRGEPPRQASDIYSAGALFGALLTGDLEGDLDSLGARERAVVDAATTEDPSARPDAPTLLRMLRIRAADARELRAARSGVFASAAEDERLAPTAGESLVTAAPTWPEELLDELARRDHPWIQPILDRDGEQFVVAAWPTTCRPLSATDDLSRAPLEVLDDGLSEELRAAIHRRLAADAWILAPGGTWMLSLEALLRR